MAERRTRITIETERILIIAHQQPASGWCQECGGEVKLLPQDQAGRLLEAVPQSAEYEHPGKLHLEQAKDGLVVCLKSLLRFVQAAGGHRTP